MEKLLHGKTEAREENSPSLPLSATKISVKLVLD
jgi:hypothetical protein